MSASRKTLNCIYNPSNVHNDEPQNLHRFRPTSTRTLEGRKRIAEMTEVSKNPTGDPIVTLSVKPFARVCYQYTHGYRRSNFLMHNVFPTHIQQKFKHSSNLDILQDNPGSLFPIL